MGVHTTHIRVHTHVHTHTNTHTQRFTRSRVSLTQVQARKPQAGDANTQKGLSGPYFLTLLLGTPGRNQTPATRPTASNKRVSPLLSLRLFKCKPYRTSIYMFRE